MSQFTQFMAYYCSKSLVLIVFWKVWTEVWVTGKKKKWPKYLGETLSSFNSCLDLPGITEIKRRVSEKKKTKNTADMFSLCFNLEPSWPKITEEKDADIL